jgi:hypothetical protein
MHNGDIIVENHVTALKISSYLLLQLLEKPLLTPRTRHITQQQRFDLFGPGHRQAAPQKPHISTSKAEIPPPGLENRVSDRIRDFSASTHFSIILSNAPVSLTQGPNFAKSGRFYKYGRHNS